MVRREANEAERDYLKMIQAVIDRMARCSFLIKGWNIAIIAALLAINAKDSNPWLSAIGFLPIIVFWILDSYYLHQERLFRALYSKAISELDIALKDRTLPLFSMNTKVFRDEVASWFRVAWSRTIWPFYLFMFLIIFVVTALSFGFPFRIHFCGF